MKQCLQCQKEKDIMQFYSLSTDDANFYSVCSACRLDGYENPEHAEKTNFKFKHEVKYAQMGRGKRRLGRTR